MCMSLNRMKQWRRYIACFFPSLFLTSDGNIPLRANARDGAPPPPLPRAGPTFQPLSAPPSFSTERHLVTTFPSSSQYGARKAYLDHSSTVSSFCPAPTMAAPLSPAPTMALHDLRRSYLPTPAQVSLHNSRDVHVVKQTKTARLPSPLQVQRSSGSLSVCHRMLHFTGAVDESARALSRTAMLWTAMTMCMLAFY